MFENDIIKYFDSIEPSDELIERTVTMSNNGTNKKIKFTKRTISILVAAIILALGITGYAGINKIINDKKGMVAELKINNKSSGFVFDFNRAEKKAVVLSDTDNEIVKALNKEGYKDIVMPKAITDSGYKIDNIGAFVTENSSMVNLSKGSKSITFTLVAGVSSEEMNGFWGVGGENSTCEVLNVNGMDVCITYDGDENIGYTAYIIYANNDYMYEFNCPSSNNLEETKTMAREIAQSLDQK